MAEVRARVRAGVLGFRVRVNVRVSEFDGCVVRKLRAHARRHIYDSILGLGLELGAVC